MGEERGGEAGGGQEGRSGGIQEREECGVAGRRQAEEEEIEKEKENGSKSPEFQELPEEKSR